MGKTETENTISGRIAARQSVTCLLMSACGRTMPYQRAYSGPPFTPPRTVTFPSRIGGSSVGFGGGRGDVDITEAAAVVGGSIANAERRNSPMASAVMAAMRAITGARNYRACPYVAFCKRGLSSRAGVHCALPHSPPSSKAAPRPTSTKVFHTNAAHPGFFIMAVELE